MEYEETLKHNTQQNIFLKKTFYFNRLSYYVNKKIILKNQQNEK